MWFPRRRSCCNDEPMSQAGDPFPGIEINVPMPEVKPLKVPYSQGGIDVKAAAKAIRNLTESLNEDRKKRD